MTMIFSVAAIGVLSFIFGKLIFTAAPAAVEELLFSNLLRIKLLIIYLKDLSKLFFYLFIYT